MQLLKVSQQINYHRLYAILALKGYFPMEEMKKHAFEPIHPEFYKTVEKGDIIVAGKNFGCGSSREQATSVVKELGFRYIVCESMGRIYFRNCVALGVYPILSKGACTLFGEGDDIEMDLEKGEIRNPRTGESAAFEPLSGALKEILDGGGVIPRIKKILNRE